MNDIATAKKEMRKQLWMTIVYFYVKLMDLVLKVIMIKNQTVTIKFYDIKCTFLQHIQYFLCHTYANGFTSLPINI